MPSIFADISLPAIGQDSHYQLQKEQEIGRRFYQRLISANKIINDPLVDFYLKEVSSILLQNLDSNYRSFNIFMINDSAINAFAVPGGYIGINYGLILSAKTEAQLAGVLSHEISHISLNHLAQFLKKRDTANTALITSLLLALILSQSLDSEGKSEAIEAMVLGSTAGAHQSLINFTRENEYEADRKGLELMKKAGYPAVGMAEFFSVLEGEGGSGEVASIEYLRTHPISNNRMGEAYQLTSKRSLFAETELIEFKLFQVYINSLVGGTYKSLSADPTVVSYESALNAIKINKNALAINILQGLYREDNENLWVIYELIRLYFKQNKYEKVLQLIDDALGVYPNQSLFLTQKIKALVLLENFDSALLIAKGLLNVDKDNQTVRFQLVGIYEQLNLSNKAREIEGDYMLQEGNLLRAKSLYQLVLKNTKEASVRQGLIEKIAKVKQLEKINGELEN